MCKYKCYDLYFLEITFEAQLSTTSILPSTVACRTGIKSSITFTYFKNSQCGCVFYQCNLVIITRTDVSVVFCPGDFHWHRTCDVTLERTTSPKSNFNWQRLHVKGRWYQMFWRGGKRGNYICLLSLFLKKNKPQSPAVI